MSENGCDHGGDLIGWLLGALSLEEADRFAAHLRDCACCQAELARLSETTEPLLEAVTPVAPPSELRERLMSAVHAESTLLKAATADSRPVKAERRRSRLTVLIGLILASLIAALGAVVVLISDSATHPNAAQTVLGRVTPAAGAHARALVRIDQHVAILVVSRLALPPRGHVYQAWVISRGSPAVPTGALFSVPPSGDTQILLPSLRNIVRVIVSTEPPRGSRTPTPPPIVIVDLAHPRGPPQRG